MSDFNCDLDDILSREVLDKTKHLHGEALIDFLLDAKMCVSNGRLSKGRNRYTVLNSNGRSVVDYMIDPHDVLELCKSFEIMSCDDIIEQCNQMHPM